jgi:hypothetical protein
MHFDSRRGPAQMREAGAGSLVFKNRAGGDDNPRGEPTDGDQAK